MCDVAIIGAGPYGLSLAAQLGARGVDYRIFGKPLGTWREHMPKDMWLKSDGFASNLSAPAPDSTLKAYCAARNVPYSDEALPVTLDVFLEYADWFRSRYVRDVEDVQVTNLKRDGVGYTLTLDNGEQARAREVVLAVGITWFAHTPDVLAALPKELVSHSYDHRDVSQFKGRDVAVIGAGASAVDLASLLHDTGASVRLLARVPELDFNSVPDPDAETLMYKIQRPASGIGRGWRSLFCAAAPLLFYRLPENLKQRAISSHMHPAAGFFMRQKVGGKIPTVLGRTITAARAVRGKAELTLKDTAGREETLLCDHVIAATGYQPDMRRLPFLASGLLRQIQPGDALSTISDNFETRAPGVYVMGLAAMHAFGPLLRFMYGAEFVAPRLGAHLGRKFGSRSLQRAA
jgi:thioredoxin reductase